MLSRRGVLATAAAGAAMSATAAAAASFGNPDEPPQGAINAKNPTSVSDPGPQDPAIRDQLPSAFSPPATDVGSMPSKSSPFVTETKGGTLQVVDSRTFNVSKTIAVALQTIRPGAMRQMHWHPNADEWQYYIKGKARMGVFNTGPNVVTMDFNPGDIGYAPRNYGHYVQNIGDTDMQFFAVFRTPQFEEFSLANWLAHSPPDMVAEHLNVDPATVSRWGSTTAIMPA